MAPQTDSHHCPALLIAAPASGQGKTTVTAALARLHTRLGRRVRVFKCGPDFLDPMILARASGQPVYQLDLWMVGEAESRRLLAEAAASADLILIEGVMGLFDGQPSAADLARRFGVPVLAVIDASAMAQTFAALAHGLATFQPDLPFAGVLANRVGSARHGEILRDALPAHLRWFAALPRSAEVELPSRHLGLVQAEELADLDARLDAAADALAASADTALPAPVAFIRETVASTPSPSGAAHGRDSGTAEQLAATGRSCRDCAGLPNAADSRDIDTDTPTPAPTAFVGATHGRDSGSVEQLAAMGRSYRDPAGLPNAADSRDVDTDTPTPAPTASVGAAHGRDAGAPLAGTRIAVARDAAFAFLYQANLDLLEALGAELRFFSPLKDPELPPADSLYLPGGYPELHLDALSQNRPMIDSIRAHHAAGQPILAECGGMLYLLEALTDKTGQRAELVGLLPGAAQMQPKLAALALQEVVLPEGTLRGHTYHHSTLATELAPIARGECPNYRRTAEAVYRLGRLTASYIHLYLPSDPVAAAALFRS